MVIGQCHYHIRDHCLYLSRLYRIPLRHPVDDYRIIPERGDVKSQGGKHGGMFLEKQPVLHPYLDRYREKGALGNMLICGQGLHKPLIEDALLGSADIDDQQSGPDRCDKIPVLDNDNRLRRKSPVLEQLAIVIPPVYGKAAAGMTFRAPRARLWQAFPPLRPTALWEAQSAGSPLP